MMRRKKNSRLINDDTTSDKIDGAACNERAWANEDTAEYSLYGWVKEEDYNAKLNDTDSYILWTQIWINVLPWWQLIANEDEEILS